HDAHPQLQPFPTRRSSDLTSATARNFARELESREEVGVTIVGFVDAEPATDVIGSFDDIPAIVRARSVDRVVVSLADARGKLPRSEEHTSELQSPDHLVCR